MHQRLKRLCLAGYATAAPAVGAPSMLPEEAERDPSFIPHQHQPLHQVPVLLCSTALLQDQGPQSVSSWKSALDCNIAVQC